MYKNHYFVVFFKSFFFFSFLHFVSWIWRFRVLTLKSSCYIILSTYLMGQYKSSPSPPKNTLKAHLSTLQIFTLHPIETFKLLEKIICPTGVFKAYNMSSILWFLNKDFLKTDSFFSYYYDFRCRKWNRDKGGGVTTLKNTIWGVV